MSKISRKTQKLLIPSSLPLLEISQVLSNDPSPLPKESYLLGEMAPLGLVLILISNSLTYRHQVSMVETSGRLILFLMHTTVGCNLTTDSQFYLTQLHSNIIYSSIIIAITLNVKGISITEYGQCSVESTDPTCLNIILSLQTTKKREREM